MYQSARTNRPHIFKEEGGFGTLTTFIEAKPYRNKEFKFTASVKNAANEGAGFLWARVDLENYKPGFFDNMND